MSSCVCCASFRPRYKRLVDNIFPATSDSGLVRSEMEKLTYYAVSAPEKLDRIGEYLAHKLTRSISRKQNNSVFIAMEALDRLLLACHAQQINSFVESFLKMVGQLLESDNLEFQAVGTNSFIKFSKIEEDTISYQRRYDFFVSKFSAMCHSHLENLHDRKKIQGHGVRGIHGVIRKTVADNRQVNIWQQHHMDKIIPSLLYVMMQDKGPEETPAKESVAQNEDASENIGNNAEDCLRELLSRASYTNLSSVLKPAFSHLDGHKLWNPVNMFAIKCFKVLMFAIQAQHTHVVVKMLLDHLDEQDIDKGKLKASMLDVLCAIVVLPLSSPIGPAVEEVFRQLTRHLRLSIDSDNPQEQKAFQNAFIKTIGILCGVLPDFQKSEAMVFFITKAKEHISKNMIKYHDLSGEKLEKLLNLLLQSLYRIAENYKSRNLSGMSSSLLDPLIKVSSAATSKNRLIMQETLTRLLDRENNFELLQVVNSVAGAESLALSITEVSAQDMDIVERKVPALLQYIYESSCLPDNTVENYIALFKCTSMLCISLSSPDIVVDACRVLLALQTKSRLDEPGVCGKNRTHLFGMMSACMCVLAFAAKVTGLVAYVTSVMQSRLKDSSLQYLDPCYSLSQPDSSVTPLPDKIDEHLLFSEKQLQSCFEDLVVYKIDRLIQPFVPTLPETESIQMKKSFMDADSVRIEVPGPVDDQTDSDQGKITPKMITYSYLKKKFSEEPPTRLEIAETKRKAAEHVMTSTFEQLVAEVQSKTPSNRDIFELIERSCVSDDNDVTVLPFSLPGECKPGSNNLVFPSVCVL